MKFIYYNLYNVIARSMTSYEKFGHIHEAFPQPSHLADKMFLYLSIKGNSRC